MLLPFLASADVVEIGGIYYNLVTKALEAEVTSNPSKYKGDVKIPAQVTYEGKTYSVTSIGSRAFSDCSGLTSVNIPNSVKSLGETAFGYCSSLTSVTIPNSVTSIGKHAFSLCKSLTSVNIPNSVTSIAYSTFYGCSGLTSVAIPNGVTSIEISAFEKCTGLTSVTIPNSVTSISNYAFSNCSSLPSVTIPNSVTNIFYHAFEGCSSLTSVYIGTGIEKISEKAFANCTELIDIICYAEKVPGVSSDAFENSYIQSVTLHVPSASVDLYRAKNVWKDFKSIVAIEQNTQRCEEPTINYANGELTFSCATEGVGYVTEITADDAKKYYDSKITLSGTYNVSVYATKDGYESSDVVKKQIVLGKTSDSQGGSQESNKDDTSIEGDLTGDGKVNAEDVVKLVGLVMKQEAGGDTPSTPNTPADDSEVTSKISAAYLNSAAINANGVFLNGSQFGWYFINESSVTVQLISAVLIDAATGVAGSNVLTEPVDVAAGEKKFQATAVTGSGISQPKVKFTYKYNNKEYSVEATMPLS